LRGRLVRDMDLSEGSNSNAAAAGFFEYIEVLLVRAARELDPFKHLEDLVRQFDEAMEAQGYPDADPQTLDTQRSRLACAVNSRR